MKNGIEDIIFIWGMIMSNCCMWVFQTWTLWQFTLPLKYIIIDGSHATEMRLRSCNELGALKSKHTAPSACFSRKSAACCSIHVCGRSADSQACSWKAESAGHLLGVDIVRSEPAFYALNRCMQGKNISEKTWWPKHIVLLWDKQTACKNVSYIILYYI